MVGEQATYTLATCDLLLATHYVCNWNSRTR